MAWYEFGTATVAAGGTAVTLSAGATAIANIKAGDSLIFKGSQFPPVEIGANPTVNTTITLRNAWPYAAQTNVAYTIQPGPGWNSVATLGQDVSQYLAAVSGVFGSDTSNTITTGSKTWNIQPNARLAVGARVRFSDIAAPSTNWAEGVVTAYAGRALTVNVDLIGGSGTKALWNWNHAGDRGAVGAAASTPGTTVAGYVPVWGNTTGTDLAAGFKPREVLTAARTYYVATTGSNSNSGLAVGTPFLTLQKALDTVAGLDLSIYNVTIQLADGTYAESTTLKSPAGSGTVTITGNASNRAAVIIANPSTASGGCFQAFEQSSIFQISHLKMTGPGSGVSSGIRNYGSKIYLNNVEFGAGLSTHVLGSRALIQYNGPEFISGGAGEHWQLSAYSLLSASGYAVTLTGTPAFTYFVIADQSRVEAWSKTFTGGGTGTRYYSANGSLIQTLGGGASYFPGSIAGSAPNGGIYA